MLAKLRGYIGIYPRFYGLVTIFFFFLFFSRLFLFTKSNPSVEYRESEICAYMYVHVYAMQGMHAHIYI